MSRTQGAKNIPKTTAELELELLQRYAADGQKPAEKKAAKKPTKKLELEPVAKETKEEEKDTYICATCKGKLDAKVARCPHCNVELRWP